MSLPSRPNIRRSGRVYLRRGFTLIEMVAVVGLVTLVLSSVAVTISSLHRLNSKLRDEFPRSAAVVSLGLQLRSDAHAARQATLDTTDQTQSVLRLVLADQRVVEYSAKNSRISRFVKLSDKVERTEVFLLPGGCQVNWSIDDNAMPQVTLAIERHVGKLPNALDDVRVLKIITMVGMDQVTR